MIEALGWGALAASSLFVGAILGVARTWRAGLVGGVLAFGAGALISSVAFELAEEGLARGGPLPVALGIAAGAVSFALGNAGVQRLGARRRRGASGRRDDLAGEDAGASLAVGAFLDGIPEQAVLGIGLASGGGVSIALLVAVWISNLPESIGSAADMRRSGVAPRLVLLLWAGVALVCASATLAGWAIAHVSGDGTTAAVNGFAAGALLVMLVDEMVPEAQHKVGAAAGLLTAVGFALAAGLSKLT